MNELSRTLIVDQPLALSVFFKCIETYTGHLSYFFNFIYILAQLVPKIPVCWQGGTRYVCNFLCQIIRVNIYNLRTLNKQKKIHFKHWLRSLKIQFKKTYNETKTIGVSSTPVPAPPAALACPPSLLQLLQGPSCMGKFPLNVNKYMCMV